ncbi:hypothetical protein OROHE_023544 [Orobanche hederae]
MMEGSPIARGRGRGGRSGNNFTSAEFEDGGYEQDHGYASGRGRGRGRNFRGRGRGGYYSGPRFDNRHDNTDGYNKEASREVVAVGGGLVKGPVDSDLTGRSIILGPEVWCLLCEDLRCSSLMG